MIAANDALATATYLLAPPPKAAAHSQRARPSGAAEAERLREIERNRTTTIHSTGELRRQQTLHRLAANVSAMRVLNGLAAYTSDAASPEPIDLARHIVPYHSTPFSIPFAK